MYNNRRPAGIKIKLINVDQTGASEVPRFDGLRLSFGFLRRVFLPIKIAPNNTAVRTGDPFHCDDTNAHPSNANVPFGDVANCEHTQGRSLLETTLRPLASRYFSNVLFDLTVN